jgi:hypothetical protein
MRCGDKPSFLENKKGEFLGVNLSSDFCAEHEWGIKDLKRDFGVDVTNGYGIDRRIIRRIPPEPTGDYGHALRFFEAGKNWCLAYAGLGNLKELAEKGCTSELRMRDAGQYIKESDSIGGAWDGGTFGVLVRPKDRGKLEELHEAFKRLDVVITFAAGFFIENPGLCLLIASKVDEETKDKLTEIDKDHERLLKAAEETTIEKHLKRSGKDWFALEPHWISDNLKKRSRHKVMFWLNPMEQHIHNAGWFTVEDLLAWSEGKGRIMMDQKTGKR